MNDIHHSNDKNCPSEPTLMAFVDAQLGGAEREAVRSHLAVCERCHRMTEEMATASKAVGTYLSCLDDGSMSAYVDYQMGRTPETLSAGELRRIRYHLDRCKRCREEVEVLLRACETRVGTLDRLRSLLGVGGRTEGPAARPALRRVAVTAIVVAVLLAFLGLRGREPGPVPPAEREVVEAPVAPSPEPDTTTAIAERPTSESGVPDEPPSEAPLPDTAPGVERPSAGQQRPPQPELTMETALMAELAAAQGELAEALTALAEATKSGDAVAEARAALEVGGIYHLDRDYESAARHYRGAIAGAEKAGELELHIDSTILLGAALAEMGETGEARQHFDLALEMAREAGYDRGETNALVQLRVLEGESAQAQH